MYTLTPGLLIAVAILAQSYWITNAVSMITIPQRDMVISVRCVDYEEPLLVSPEPGSLPTKQIGWIKRPQPFDITMNLAKRVGWYEGGSSNLSEDSPSKLTVQPTQYRLEIDGTAQSRLTEWLVLDRLDGTLTLYSQNLGMPAETLKRGGVCGILETKF